MRKDGFLVHALQPSQRFGHTCPILRIKLSMKIFTQISLAAGGLALFLYAMRLFARALNLLCGKKLRIILAKGCGGRLRSFGTGLAVTALLQSSSATTLLLVGFADAKVLRFSQGSGAVLGAEVGTTVTLFLVAARGVFSLMEITALGAAVGAVMLLLGKKESVGELLVAVGMLFLGLELIANAAAPLAKSTLFLRLFSSASPLLLTAGGTLFTALIQSSSAATAVFAAGGIPLRSAVWLTLGSNLGTTVTALLASIGSNREGKKFAYFHFFVKLGGVTLALPLMVLLQNPLFRLLGGVADSVRALAYFNTAFNLALAAVVLPFCPKTEQSRKPRAAGGLRKLICRAKMPPQ